MVSDEQAAWVARLTVAKLKDELKARSLPVSGLKAELAARLTEALTSEQVKKTPESDREGASDEAHAGTPGAQQAVQQGESEATDGPVLPVKESEELTAAATTTHAQGTNAHDDLAAPEAATPEPATSAQGQPKSQQDGEQGAVKAPQANTGLQAQMAGPGTAPGVVVASASPPALEPPSLVPVPIHAQEEEVDYGVDEDEPPAPSAVVARAEQEAAPAQGAGDASHGGEQPPAGAPEAHALKRRPPPIAFEPKPKQDSGGLAKAPSAKRPVSPGVEQSGAKRAAVRAPVANPPAAVALSAAPAPITDAGPATDALRIDNLVRPLTEAQLRELIGRTGTIIDLWMPTIKTHAFVVLESAEQGAATHSALHGLKWPPTSPKRLTVTFLTRSEAEQGIAVGRDPTKARLALSRTPSKSTPVPAPAPAPAPADAPAAEPDAAPNLTPTPTPVAAPAQAEALNTTVPMEEDEAPSLDQLFRKTVAKPAIYWLPLSDDEVKEKAARLEKEAAEQAAAAAAPPPHPEALKHSAPLPPPPPPLAPPAPDRLNGGYNQQSRYQQPSGGGGGNRGYDRPQGGVGPQRRGGGGWDSRDSAAGGSGRYRY